MLRYDEESVRGALGLLGVAVRVEDRPEPSLEGLEKLPVQAPGGGVDVWADHDRAVHRFEGVGWFEVRDGREVSCLVRPESSTETLLACLHGAVAGSALNQQGRFALHGSTTDVRGARVTVCGYSGAGKSTTSLALVERGAGPVCDDVTVLDVEDGRAFTAGFGREVRVAPETAELIGMDLTGIDVSRARAGKLWLEWTLGDRGPVDLVVALAKGDVDAPVVERCDASVGFVVLSMHTYMRRAVEVVCPQEWFAWCTQAAAAVEVVQIVRPAERWSLDEVLDVVEDLAAGVAAVRQGGAGA